jgi:AraC family transcriptional regulator, melibiose operon regulatory protein
VSIVTPTKTDNTSPERRFYSRSRAFGRFGMRIFKPSLMQQPHWHGHVEINYIRHGRMTYIMDGQKLTVEPDQMLVFWAGVPHQLVTCESDGQNEPELANIYVPLDTFLYMPHIPALQVALLTGGVVIIPRELCDFTQVQRWYRDYRSNEAERHDIVKSEINLVLRRYALELPVFLKSPWQDNTARHGEAVHMAAPHVRHVVSMVRHVLDHLTEPLRNDDVTRVTGLHTNYALALFTRTMMIPLKQFIIRMRLLRARSLLLESEIAIATVAVESGFGSASQFYAHFSAAYGVSPQSLRNSYTHQK